MLAKAKVIKGGKISIPAVCRKYLGIKDGEQVIFTTNKEGDVLISSFKLSLERARKLINKHIPPNINLVDELIAERRREAKKEEEEAARWNKKK